MRTLWQRFSTFFKRMMWLGLISLVFTVVAGLVFGTGPEIHALTLVPRIIIGIDAAILVLLVVLSPLMWLFAIITGTIGVGVAVGNRISRQ
jgi:hypothetical protein